VVAKKSLPFLNGESTLTSIVDSLNQLNQKLDSLIKYSAQILKVNQTLLQKTSDNKEKTDLNIDPDAFALLSLPMSLRKTVMVLYRLDRATADELAKETGRLRAVESASANQLVRMGYLKKSREGRDVFFYIRESPEDKR
jgi:DNA-binding MarR family transcriptional regulator